MNNKANYIIAALAAVVVILLVVIAFMLGRSTGSRGENTTSGLPESVETSSNAEVSPSGEDGSETSESAQNDPEEETQNAPRNLDISMTAGSLTFVSGSEFNVDFDSSVIDVSTSGDTMKILNAHSHPSAAERRKMDVKITVPDEYTFGSVDIEFGAGKLIVHSLSVDTLTMELGAGSAAFNNICVTGSADIKEGAGELVISSGNIADLNLTCGAGATKVYAALTGTNTITAAFGAVDINLKGAEDDYSVSFQVGLGACYYNGEKLSRSASFGSGENTVQITGGLGAMRITVND